MLDEKEGKMHYKLLFSIFLSIIFLIPVFPILGQDHEYHTNFFEARNIASYILSIDTLIKDAQQHIFQSLEAFKTGRIAEVDTSNNIRLSYGIVKEDGGYRHHLALSQLGGLPNIFAKNLVSLFSLRAKLPLPQKIYRSPRGVYHVEWSEPTIILIENFKIEKAGQPLEEYFADAVAKSSDIEIEEFKD